MMVSAIPAREPERSSDRPRSANELMMALAPAAFAAGAGAFASGDDVGTPLAILGSRCATFG
jgi:hypothetical protein